MFRQKQYSNNEDNSLMNRLYYLDDNDINYDKIKFWDINHNAWVDCDNLNDYKIQEETVINDELIFRIYRENDDAGECVK